jgi:ABC-2 type transport system permease protein
MMWIIAKREFRTRTLSKASIISTCIMVGLILAAAFILKPFLDGGDGEPQVVQVDTATSELVPYLEQSASALDANLAVEQVDAPNPPAVADGTLALVIGDPHKPEVVLEESNDDVVAVVDAAVQSAVLAAQVSALGGDPAVFATDLANAHSTVTVLGEESDVDAGAYFAGLAAIIVLFTVLIQSASVIMMGVVEEKSSRVVEILLATVRPSTLLGGKVLGVAFYALFQVVTIAIPILFAAWYLEFLGDLQVSVSSLLANFALWFVLGFAVFVVFFGGLAALVSRQEDIGAVTTPMMLLLFVPLYLAIYLVPNNPDGTITVVLTQVPFFAPFMVPMRSAFGTITTGETLLAIAICVLTIPVLTWIAGRVYAGAVLNTGGRMKLADAFRR